jgi:hypothetical protein
MVRGEARTKRGRIASMSEKRGWLHIDSTALFVLFVPPIAYAVAFMYESGYVAYFGIPSSLAEATLASIFRSLVILMLISMFVLSAYVVVVKIVESSLIIKVPLIVSIFVVATVLLVSTAAAFKLGWSYWAGAGACCFLALTHMVGPIFSYKKKGGYAEALAAADARIRSELRVPAWPVGSEFVIPFFFFSLIALDLAFAAGRSDARRQLEFLVVERTPSCFVVRSYGDTLICAEYNGTKTVGKFKLLSKQHDSLEFELKRIGPMEPAPIELELSP